jgi:hypothetical protein
LLTEILVPLPFRIYPDVKIVSLYMLLHSLQRYFAENVLIIWEVVDRDKEPCHEFQNTNIGENYPEHSSIPPLERES